MARLRQSVVNDNSGEAGENDAAREMADQFETLQEELDRSRAECLQLKTVLANIHVPGDSTSLVSETGSSPDSDDLRIGYETQKNVIQQLQSSLKEERDKSLIMEKELRGEIEKISNLNRDQQAVIQTNMNKSPSNQTEAYMQHELTR